MVVLPPTHEEVRRQRLTFLNRPPSDSANRLAQKEPTMAVKKSKKSPRKAAPKKRSHASYVKAGKKAAATRAANKRKRSAAARKAAKTRARNAR